MPSSAIRFGVWASILLATLLPDPPRAMAQSCSDTLPQCVGECPAGATCTALDGDGDGTNDSCDCLSIGEPCGLTFPACGGTCTADDDPARDQLVCARRNDECECVNVETKACGETFPACAGQCPDGSGGCVSLDTDGDGTPESCECLSIGTPCGLTFPSCGGSCAGCDPNLVCARRGGGCECVPISTVPCGESFPSCSGTCPAGYAGCLSLDRDRDGNDDTCECVATDTPCGATFPACGGSCAAADPSGNDRLTCINQHDACRCVIDIRQSKPGLCNIDFSASDHSASFQECLDNAAALRATVWIPRDTTVKTRTALFLYGGASIEGEDRDTSVIELAGDCFERSEPLFKNGRFRSFDAGNLPIRFWINLGHRGKLANPSGWKALEAGREILCDPTGCAPARGCAVATCPPECLEQEEIRWSGHLKNLTLHLTDKADPNLTSVVQLHYAHRFVIEDVVIDQRDLRQLSNNSIGSGVTRWIVSYNGFDLERDRLVGGKIVDNIMLAENTGEGILSTDCLSSPHIIRKDICPGHVPPSVCELRRDLGGAAGLNLGNFNGGCTDSGTAMGGTFCKQCAICGEAGTCQPEWLIEGNCIDGISDDGISMKGSRGGLIRGNTVRGVRSQIDVTALPAGFSSREIVVEGNYVQRIPGDLGNNEWDQPAVYKSLHVTPESCRSGVNENIEFLCNFVYMPGKAGKPRERFSDRGRGGFFKVSDVDGLTLRDNVFVDDTVTGGVCECSGPIGFAANCSSDQDCALACGTVAPDPGAVCRGERECVRNPTCTSPQDCKHCTPGTPCVDGACDGKCHTNDACLDSSGCPGNGPCVTRPAIELEAYANYTITGCDKRPPTTDSNCVATTKCLVGGTACGCDSDCCGGTCDSGVCTELWFWPGVHPRCFGRCSENAWRCDQPPGGPCTYQGTGIPPPSGVSPGTAVPNAGMCEYWEACSDTAAQCPQKILPPAPVSTSCEYVSPPPSTPSLIVEGNILTGEGVRCGDPLITEVHTPTGTPTAPGFSLEEQLVGLSGFPAARVAQTTDSIAVGRLLSSPPHFLCSQFGTFVQGRNQVVPGRPVQDALNHWQSVCEPETPVPGLQRCTTLLACAASAPTCDGTCPPGLRCTPMGGDCVCNGDLPPSAPEDIVTPP